MPQHKTGIALITGSGRRLGYTLAHTLLQRGYRVLAQYRSPTDAVQELAAQGADLFQADFNEPEQISELLTAVQEQTQRLDVLIHNASAFQASAQETGHIISQFKSFFNIHMLAPALLNEGLCKLLAHDSQRPGNIIHITDIQVIRPQPDHHLYCASKAGLSSLTQSCARRYAPGIRVNEIAPGPILFADAHSEQHRRSVLAETPLGMEGGLEPVLQAVDYLINNAYVTGERIKVDGGRSLT